MNDTSQSVTPAALLEEMFPGDAARNLPPFSELEPEGFASVYAEAEALAPHLKEHAKSLARLSDINEKLKALRKFAPLQTQDFTIAALGRYFAAPVVVSALRGGGPAVLFPHQRSLPDIDFDLLEIVINRTSESDCR